MAGYPMVMGDDRNVNVQRAIRTDSNSVATYSYSVEQITPAATPSDVIAWMPFGELSTAFLRTLRLTATADAPGAIDCRIQRSVNDNGGTYNDVPANHIAPHDPRDVVANNSVRIYSGNRPDSLGNGVSSTRQLISSVRLPIGTASVPAEPVIINWARDGAKGLCTASLIDWIVINFNKATLPSGFKLSATFEWTEEFQRRCIIIGDSTSDPRAQGQHLWPCLRRSSGVTTSMDLRNYGSNGSTTLDFINNTGGILYYYQSVISALRINSPTGQHDRVVCCYGINDVRQGACDQATLVSRLTQVVNLIRAARPDVEFVMWGPNSFLIDTNSGGYVTLTGLFAGMTLAQASQAATDILYGAYEDMRGVVGVRAVVQKQEIFGRTCKSIADNPLMLDIVHPNEKGQILSARQIYHYLF